MNKVVVVLLAILFSSELFGIDRAAIMSDIDKKYELTSSDKKVVDVLSMLLVGENNPLGIDAKYGEQVLNRVKTFPYHRKTLEGAAKKSLTVLSDDDLASMLVLGDSLLIAEVWNAQKQLEDSNITQKLAQFDSASLGSEKELAITELANFDFTQSRVYQEPMVRLLEVIVRPAVSPDKRPLLDRFLSYIKQSYVDDTTDFAKFMLFQNKYIYRNTRIDSLNEVNRLHRNAQYLQLLNVFSLASIDTTEELIHYIQESLAPT